MKTTEEHGPETSNKELVATLRRSKLFSGYESVFSRATGLPLALQPLEYWQLAHRGKKQENPFCALLAERPETLAVCLQAHDEMIRHTGSLPHTVTCPFGLTETAIPVKLGEETIGYLRVGQVVRRAPSRADSMKVRAAVTQHGVSFTRKLEAAWEKNVLIPPDKYDAMVRLLTFFAEQLSTLCNQLVLEKKNEEPPLVSRAREYIGRHKEENLSLSAVAAAAGASVFHFCKIFHSSTGLKFTDYVARVRIEEARTHLLNPNRRVSEIAYEVGFQSLTQFNRTFKRVFGESPSDFRARHRSKPAPRRVSAKVVKTIFSGLFAFAVLTSVVLAEPTPSDKAAALPSHSQALKDVLVPVPREIFGTLDRFRDSNWRAVQRSEIARMRPRVDPTENALLLGVVIAEGFIAVDAKDAAEVKSVGNAVLRFARALGVERAALRRSRSIVEHAEKEDWPAVRKEWDSLLPGVEQGMNELKSEQLAQLVSLGGWLRGASALSALVLQNYTTKDAELLRQSALLDYFERRLAEMSDEIRANPNVVEMRAGIPKLRQLQNSDDAQISKATAQKISAIFEGLLKDLSRRSRSG